MNHLRIELENMEDEENRQMKQIVKPIYLTCPKGTKFWDQWTQMRKKAVISK